MKKRREPSPPVPSTEETSSKLNYELRFTADAAADIRRLAGSVKKQSRKVLEKKLAVDPDGYGLPLRGALANYWKHEFGNHRAIYRIYREPCVVVVCAVGVRKQGDAEDIYRQLEAVARTGRLADQLAGVLKNLIPEKR